MLPLDHKLFKMMMLLFSLFVVLAAKAAAVPVSDVPNKEYPRFIDYTDADGIVRSIDLEEQPDLELLEEVEKNPNNNFYILYTRKNPTLGQVLEMDNVLSIVFSNFNPNVSTAVIVHGWNGNQESGMNVLIRDAFLEREETNVIVLDWRRLASSNYVTAVRGVPAVGRGLGKFLEYLHNVIGASYDDMHLIGFSLGAHVVGNAGRELNGKVARATGLDPAGPLWNINSNKIKASDAHYVEGIHTDGGLTASLGIGYAIGDADFFPNGGNTQPGCLTSICHHNRAWRLFAASVTYDKFVGRECSSYLQISMNRCRGQHLNMGNSDLKKFGSGKYRLRTRRSYPYFISE